MTKVECYISKHQVSREKACKADSITSGLFNFIQRDFPGFTLDDYISFAELDNYRRKYLKEILTTEYGELDVLENQVLDAMHHNKLLSENVEPEIEERLTAGQRIADKIADFGGSWTFIIFFFAFILVWMGINLWFLSRDAFDPYPFILLNLILSCLAAIQAPIIMMSQNRKEQKDRQRSEYDYKINLKAELEIKLLHEKLDHLIVHQNKRLLEIQEIQSDYLNDIITELKKTGKKPD